MSMLARFREVTPGLLSEIEKNPSLTEAIILGAFLEEKSPGDSDLDAVFAAFPALQRQQLKDAMAKMPPEAREKMLARIGASAETLRGLTKAVRERAGASSIDPRDLGEELDIQKAWHGVHFILAGGADVTPTPLGQAILGGIEIGEDAGYGPPRYLNPHTVSSIAGELSKFTRDQFRLRYDGAAMNAAELYPGNWEDPENESWVIDALDEVAGFYQRVAGRGNAVLLYLV
jgi:uncharacterized protein DUF1877